MPAWALHRHGRPAPLPWPTLVPVTVVKGSGPVDAATTVLPAPVLAPPPPIAEPPLPDLRLRP